MSPGSITRRGGPRVVVEGITKIHGSGATGTSISTHLAQGMFSANLAPGRGRQQFVAIVFFLSIRMKQTLTHFLLERLFPLSRSFSLSLIRGTWLTCSPKGA